VDVAIYCRISTDKQDNQNQLEQGFTARRRKPSGVREGIGKQERAEKPTFVLVRSSNRRCRRGPKLEAMNPKFAVSYLTFQ
jgi:hypothetical protein